MGPPWCALARTQSLQLGALRARSNVGKGPKTRATGLLSRVTTSSCPAATSSSQSVKCVATSWTSAVFVISKTLIMRTAKVEWHLGGRF